MALWVWDGAVWKAEQGVWVWNGSAWVLMVDGWVWNGSAWALFRADPLSAPLMLAASGITDSQIQWNWTDQSTGEDEFRVARCAGASCTPVTEVHTVTSTTKATTGTNYSATSTSLAEDTTYRARVKACETGGVLCGDWSSIVSALTKLKAPSGLTASPGDTQVTLSWTNNSSAYTHVQIERCSGSGCTGFTQIAEVAAPSSGFTDTGLTNGTLYRYRVRAVKKSGPSVVNDSAYSNIAEATPAAPLTEEFLRPDSTVAAGFWTQKAGGASLHLELDETAPDDDSTYAKQANGGFAQTDKFEVGLSNPTNNPPDSGLTWRVRFRVKKVFLTGSSDTVDVVVRLKQGTTVKKTMSVSNIGTGYVTSTFVLSSAEVSSITDWLDLRLELEATWNTVAGDDIEVRFTWAEFAGESS